MDNLQVAAVDGSTDALLAGVRELPASRVWLLAAPEHLEDAKALAESLAPLHIHTRVALVEGDPVSGVIRAISQAVAQARTAPARVVVNVSSGPRDMIAAATAAAYLHGLEAFVVVGDRVTMLPVLRLPYRDLVSAPKLGILQAIAARPIESLQELATTTGLDKSLLSYHIRGNGDGGGLEALGLVRVERGARGRLGVRLTPVGEILAGTLSAEGPQAGQNASSTVESGLGHV